MTNQITLTAETTTEEMIHKARIRNNDVLSFANCSLSIERVNNDLYGNPLYKVYYTSYGLEMPKLKRVYRNYLSKGYYLEQSYNIDNDLMWMIEELATKGLQFEEVR